MSKTILAVILVIALAFVFGPTLFEMAKGDKYTYKVGETFCVENGIIPRFNAKIFGRFMLGEEQAYVAGPDFESVPMQFLSVIPVDAIDYHKENCK
jgi:hypothetical protein